MPSDRAMKLGKPRGTPNGTKRLSAREAHVVGLYLQGYGRVLIARGLELGVKTVAEYLKRAGMKLTGHGAVANQAFRDAAATYLNSLTDSPARPPVAGGCTPASSSEAPAVSSQETP